MSFLAQILDQAVKVLLNFVLEIGTQKSGKHYFPAKVLTRSHLFYNIAPVVMFCVHNTAEKSYVFAVPDQALSSASESLVSQFLSEDMKTF